MATARTFEPMTADAAGRVAEFARACKAAIRIVSMYPPSHPNIQSALTRMVAAGAAAVESGPMTLTVAPDTLRVAGRSMPRPETAVDELAVLLHAHQVGELTLQGQLTAGAWHMLLSLLATSPEDIRKEGGLSRAWQAAGGGPIEIHEIDYGEVLREKSGTVSQEIDPTWEQIIGASFGADGQSTLDERALASLLEIARDAERLGEFLVRIQERARAAGQSPEAQQEAVVRLLTSLANYAALHTPDEFDEVMNNVASGTSRVSADLMLSLLAAAGTGGEGGGTETGVDLGGELRVRFSEERLAAFVAENVERNRGATTRLAEAFNALVTSDDQRHTALLLAEERVSLSPLGADPQFNDIWAHTVKMLMSYSDADYVPEEYDREMNTARTLAVEIEQITDDPPDRIAAWLSSVKDSDMRALDQQMIVDLLRLEERPDAWASVLELAIARLEQLVLVAEIRLADQIATAVAGVAANEASPFATSARDGLSRVATAEFAGQLMACMRQMTDGDVPSLESLSRTIGPGLIAPLVKALGKEESRIAHRRTRDVLIGFGAPALEPVKALRTSPNAGVRRTAIEVMQAVGGAHALGTLQALLADSDPHVQREALRAIIRIGNRDAYAQLEHVLKSGDSRARDAILQTIGSFGDERATPLLIYILKNTSHSGKAEPVYTTAVEALGRAGSDPQGVAALKEVLYRNEWWQPFRTGRLRTAAARALHAMSSTAGDAVLEEAAARGSRGVRQAAADAMSTPRRPRSDGGTP